MSQDTIYEIIKKSKDKISANEIQEIADIRIGSVTRALTKLVEYKLIQMEKINYTGKKVYWIE